MIRAHKIALDPTNRQKMEFSKAAGCARFAYNWALENWKQLYVAGEKPNESMLRRKLNAIKREQFPWLCEVSKTVPQCAIQNLGDAFGAFFKKRTRYPRFKKKGIHDSFLASDNTPGLFRIEGRRIRLPRIGWVRMREELRFEGRLLSATVSRRAQRWYVSVLVEVEDVPIVHKNHGTVGVDLGITHLATLSTGEHIDGPRPLRAALERLRMLNKAVSRKRNGSKNRAKAKVRLARVHEKIADIRTDALHKLTTNLVQRFDVIVIEDLNVRGMAKNQRLSRAIADMGFFEFRRQLTYKALMCGSDVVVYPRFKPSSKECSDCGYVMEDLPLSVREWDCPSCGVVHDRDENAAKVLENWAASSAATACRLGSAGSSRKRRTKLPIGQEPNSIDASRG